MCLQPIYKNFRYDYVNHKYDINWRSTGLVHDISEQSIGLPCGNCPECWQKQSSEWASRCWFESKEHERNCIITLTYADTDGELCKRDYQLFLKRLRKNTGAKIKYFCSGEYGSLRGRPHFHIIIFGYCPDDLQYYKTTSKNTKLYKSKFLEKTWSHGFVDVDPNITFESCFYSAKYMQKALSFCGKKHTQMPFVAMSKGIGFKQAEKFDPIFNPYIYIKGKRYSAPRYFKKVFRKLNPNGYWYWEKEARFINDTDKRVDILNLPLYLYRSRPDLVKKKYELESSNKAKFLQFFKKLGVILS